MLEGPKEVGNIQLYALPVSHSRIYGEAYRQVVEKAVSSFKIILPEYFLPEHTGLYRYPVIGEYIKQLNATDNYLFEQVAQLCQEQKKEVWALDPAYNESFIAFRALLHTHPIATFLTLSALAGYGLYQQYKNHRITRKGFLEGCFLGSLSAVSAAKAGMIAFGAIVGPNRVPGLSVALGEIEDRFRQSQVAQHLVDLGKILPPQSEALLIYPPWHKHQIEYYRENDDARRDILDRFNGLRRFSIFQPLFQIRHYPEGVVSARTTSQTPLASLTSSAA